jgi:hypothetical protein
VTGKDGVDVGYAYCAFVTPALECLEYRPDEDGIVTLLAALTDAAWIAHPMRGRGYEVDATAVDLGGGELYAWASSSVRSNALLVELAASAGQPITRLFVMPALARVPLNSVSGEHMPCPHCGGNIAYEAAGQSRPFEAAGLWPAPERCPGCHAALRYREVTSHTVDPLTRSSIVVQSPFCRFGVVLCAGTEGDPHTTALVASAAAIVVTRTCGVDVRIMHQYW